MNGTYDIGGDGKIPTNEKIKNVYARLEKICAHCHTQIPFNAREDFCAHCQKILDVYTRAQISLKNWTGKEIPTRIHDGQTVCICPNCGGRARKIGTNIDIILCRFCGLYAYRINTTEKFKVYYKGERIDNINIHEYATTPFDNIDLSSVSNTHTVTQSKKLDASKEESNNLLKLKELNL